METKHTPGPWFPGGEPEPMGNCLAKSVCASGSFIAEVLFKDDDDAEAEANARLIAAAPELLTALEAIDLARHTDAPTDWENATKLSDVAFSKVRGR